MKFALIPLYKLMSLAFFYPEKTRWERIEKQLPLCHELVAEDILSSLNRFMAQFYICREQIETLQSEYLRLFDVGHQVSPYETEYMTGKASRKPFELADIAGFYRAFGFDVGSDLSFKEAPDHISVELKFMAILSWLEWTLFDRELNHDAYRGVRDEQLIC